MPKYLFGFDVGTYESKGVLCDFSGRIAAKASSKHVLKSPKPGWAEHDPMNDWWADLKKVVHDLLEIADCRAQDIAAIGISAVMAAITPVDRSFNPLRNAILYGIDTRCLPQVEQLNATIEPDLLRRLGGPCTVEHFGPKILWVRQNEPEIFSKAEMFTVAAGFLTGRLTGNNVSDKYSIKACVPMINQETFEWEEEFCDQICPKERMPRVAQSTYEIVGKVTADAAREVGLAEGTPVICGTTDAGAEAVSVGVVEPGDTMLMYGSTAFYVTVADSSKSCGNALWNDSYVIDGLYCYSGGMATTGSLTRWLLDNTARELVEAEKRGELNAYDTLFREAEPVPPGSDGLICLPYFLGERMPIQDPQARGTFFGLNLRHTRGHLVRAAFEGTAYGIHQNFSLLEEIGLPVREVTSVGGGTKTPLWLQIVSDVCNVRQTVPEVTVGASYGDALLAGLGIGAISSAAEIKKMVRTKYVVEPDLDRHRFYKTREPVFCQLYERNKDLMHILSQNN